MDQRARLKQIPTHSGPDGQGLPQPAFDELLRLLDGPVDPDHAVFAIELCLGASTQSQWNDEYRPILIERYVEKSEE